MFKKITALLIAAIMIISLWSCKNEDDKKQTINDKEINSVVVMATENFEISVSMMTYFFNAYYRSFITNNSSNLAQFGLDITKPLNEQKYTEEYTWKDYFLFQISDSLKQQLVLAEDAKKNGFELTDADYETIDGDIAKLDALAAESNNATSYVIQSSYGECVNELTIRKCLELSTLVRNYTSSLTSGYKFSDDDINEYFTDNKNELLSFNYIRYQVAGEDQDKIVEDFSNCTTEESFVDMIKKYAKEAVYDADEEYMQNLMDNCYVYGAAYNENSEFAKWAFAEGRKAYDIYTSKKEGSGVLVAMALPASEEAYSEVLWKDITPLHNITSMCFTEKEYGSTELAKTKAESVLNEIKNGASFDKLCNDYAGGTTSNMVRGTAPSAIEAWVFDDSRATGDITAITISGTGTYLIRMENDGAKAWEYFALDGLTNKIFSDYLNNLLENTDITTNNSAVSQITPITLT